ncbi:MAG: 50S ribosomal protein L23 [Candidatus Omnitrophica bacterium]|nr:50S ribosomal protein L23 [Candidatus Omnitrophota bacterium]
MKNPCDVVKGLLRTEKGGRLMTLNQYLFWVDMKSNKIEIRKAVEEIYKVKVKSVNTSMVRGKMRRIRYKEGKTSDWKKAIVTLQAGNKIDVA